MSAEGELWSALHEHELGDIERHGEAIGAIGVVSTKLDTLIEQVGRIDSRQWDEHPSKVQNQPPATVRKSEPPAYKVDAKKLGYTIGAVLVFLETWAQVRSALAGWLAHH